MDVLSHYGFWAVLGLVLLMAELASLTFIIFFFGVGALVVAILTFTGLLSDPASQMMAFSVISVLTLLFLRKAGRRWLEGKISDTSEADQDSTGLINSRGQALEDFHQGRGRVIVHGTGWNATLPGWTPDVPIDAVKARDSVIVIGVSGNALIVSPLPSVH